MAPGCSMDPWVGMCPSSLRLPLRLLRHAALLPLLLLLLPGILVSGATILEVRVHYPAAQLQLLSSKAVFTLGVCYGQQGCPASGQWNQSIPGLPYDPQLTIFQDDYFGDDLFVKTIELDNAAADGNSGGDAFVTISAAYEPAGNPFGTCAVKYFCNSSALDPVSTACVNVGMPYRSSEQQQQQHSLGPRAASRLLLVEAFPYFGMEQGSVSTLLPNVYSPQLRNYRDVQVYLPASLAQNPLPRVVNVLVVNDGTLYFLERLAFAPGGFDSAVLSGAVPAETIMIGVPQNGTGCQRQFELTFSVTSATSPCPSGGADLYLAFITATVVPAAVAALNATLGEVSMTGVSYGGLAACYAGATQPLYFRRVFCQSPSVYWNYGELTRVVAASSASTGHRPLSVVAYIGTNEMEAPLCVDLACSATTPWFTYVNDTVEAFRSAGVDNLYFFTLSGGQHEATAWATSFAAGVIQMYAANFTAPFQLQYSAVSSSTTGSSNGAVNVVYPAQANTTCPSTLQSATAAEVVLGVLLALETLAVVVFVVVFRTRLTHAYSVQQ